MHVTWTGADATALRKALGLPQQRFADRLGIHVQTVKKWASRGTTIQLDEFYAGLMATLLDAATPEQRGHFHTRRQQVATPEPDVAGKGMDIAEWDSKSWSNDCATVTAELTRRDLMLDRRQATQALIGVVVGAKLLEPLEQWLQRVSQEPVAAITHGSIGIQEVEQLENAARMFREWDDQFGGGLRRRAVVGQLSEVNELLQDSHPPQIQRRLRRVLALLAEAAATMSWDSGLQTAAQEYYMLAVGSAKAAGDPALCANAMAGMARQLLSLNHYGTVSGRRDLEHQRAVDALEVIRLAQDQFGDAVTPTVRAMLYTREAWAYGKLDRPSAFRRTCDKAHRAFAAADPDCDPYWIRYFDAAELSGTLGGRLLEIARNDSGFAAEAAREIERAIELRVPGRLRSSALDRLGIVEARLLEGELDEAARLGHEALNTVEQTTSDRVRKKLLNVYSRTDHLAGVRSVAELRDRVRPLIIDTV
ncbi:putative regulatory protein [Nocardia nova SH22a]|uniref:Putative regulatory protein n=1 Tax=Nocardia nova SH22a TaxID=1415166 RepID=W5TB99_9NOCA|nr:helix-turn-helix domain-containing protein [Nocardia nova]AHH16253.1 putative regulatory protein [Nocardia nova SH22a]